jgi:hypothetical protein
VAHEFHATAKPSRDLKFRYATALVHSHHRKDISEGQMRLLQMLDSLNASNSSADEEERSSILYYLTIACIRLDDYKEALRWCDLLKKTSNYKTQADELRNLIKERGERG